MSKNVLIADAALSGLSTDATALVGTLMSLQTALPWIIGIGAAIGAVAIGIKAYRDAHPTLEMLQKDADAAKQEFDEMQSKVDETQKRIDELNALKESGGLSSTEQAELDNLTSQNEQYERQLELLKEIAEYKQDRVTEKANSDAAKALKSFTDNAWQERLDGIGELERNSSGLGGLLNAISDYTTASEKLDAVNKAIADAKLDNADEETLDGLHKELVKAEDGLNKQRETLSVFQDFLVGLRGDLTDKESIATVDSLLDTIAATLGIKDSEKTFDNFKKGLKQIGDDADDVVNTFLKDGKLTEDQSRRLAQCLTEMGYSAEDAAIYFERMSRDMANATEQSTSAQINDLVSFRDELAVTSKALEDYKKALEGGEKGDAAAEMAKAYQSAVESYKAGKTDTYEMRAAADLFFNRDFLAQNNIGLDKVGELLSSGIWEAVFASDDYATNFVSYLQEHASELGDAVKVTADAAGNVQFAYKSVSALAEATNMSEASVIALLDALDVLGVQAMMSGEDMGELVDRLGLIPGETVKSAEGIQQIIQSLADDGLGYWDIQGALNSLESAGMIDTTGIQDLYQWINDATKGLDELNQKSSDVKVDADTSVAEKAVDGFKSRLDALLAGSPYKVGIVANITTNGELPSAVSGGSGYGGSGFTGRKGHFAGGTTNAPRGKAYVNELGPETVIQDGVAKEFNDGKPALVDLKPGDIVLPADVTADAKKNGHRVKKYGSAARGISQTIDFAIFDGGGNKKKPIIDTLQDVVKKALDKLKQKGSGSGSGSGGGGGGGGSTGSDKKQKIDWIEVAIDRIERKVKSLARVASSAFKKLSTRLTASKDEISIITKEIDTQQKAYARYLKEADSVGLDKGIAKLVRDGTINIAEYDEDTQKLIKDYQTWYEKAIDCAYAVDELHDSLAELYQSRFDTVQKDYENQLSEIEHRMAMYDKTLELYQTQGYMDSSKYYLSLSDVQQENISVMQKELADLKKYLNEAMDSGEIEKYSESWYEMMDAIYGVEEGIADAKIQLAEYEKTIREIEWSYFDFTQSQISKLNDEADFLIELMSNQNLFDDSGQLNEEGIATVGLHAQKFDTYMAQADAYYQEMQKIEQQIAKDPYNKDLIERREELLSLQQDSILAAEAEKQAVASLVEDGISQELSALKELIDSYEDSLDSAKDLYDYQKKISSQTSDIANIQKQLAAYAGDNSDENRARIQKLQVKLAEAQEKLEETEYDQYIKDQKQLLSGLYDEYEEMLNARLDDIDALFREMIDLSNDHAAFIGETLSDIAQSVGYTLSDGTTSVWQGGHPSVSEYGSQMSNVLDYLSVIQAGIQQLAAASDRAIIGDIKTYATGGIVRETGLAHLDGTPSNPELVLNQSDSRNFLYLRDMMRNTTPYLSALSGGLRFSGAFGSYAVPSGTSIGEVNMTIEIDHVEGYDDMIAQMKKDPKFERLVQAMTTDRLSGGSKLKKFTT